MKSTQTYQIDRLSKKYLPLLIIFQCYAPIVDFFNAGKFSQIYQYVIYGLLAVFSVCYFWVHRGHFVSKFPQLSALYIFMVVYVIAASIKLIYVPSSIFFYQRLVTFCSFLSVGVVFLLMSEDVLKRTFRMWWRFVPWITFITIPLGVTSYKIVVMFLVFLFLILSGCLRKQLKFLTYAIVTIMALFFVQQRMDYLFILAPITVYYMIKYNIFLSFKKSIIFYHILMWIPIFFLGLAYFSNFNVLNFDSYIKGEYISSTGERLTDDTRTGLYIEAFESARNNRYMLLGRTPGYGYDSNFVKVRKGTFLDVKDANPQRASEVFIVNIFTWCGVVGVVVWFVFFYWFGIYILKRARNNYIRGLAIYLGFFWICDWISNGFSAPTNIYITLFIIWALCLQPNIRCMNDDEIRHYFKKMLW